MTRQNYQQDIGVCGPFSTSCRHWTPRRRCHGKTIVRWNLQQKVEIEISLLKIAMNMFNTEKTKQKREGRKNYEE